MKYETAVIKWIKSKYSHKIDWSKGEITSVKIDTELVSGGFGYCDTCSYEEVRIVARIFFDRKYQTLYLKEDFGQIVKEIVEISQTES